MRSNKSQKRMRRRLHIRKSLSGSAEILRLSIFRSNKYIYVQLVDDDTGTCSMGFSDRGIKMSAKEKPMQKAEKFGKEYAVLLKKAKVKQVVFDRGGYKYHGRIKVFADSLRQAGIKF
ncbi:MAG: 50S ribosomal protein L18 [Patescibacteria group bacterium]|nr:50S ribosomal protein L18 [Patescibacteria group bacterium]